MIETIVFEENGFPVELGSVREVERAIANGRLRADTLVRTWLEDGASRTAPASQVVWLRPLLGLTEPVAPPPAIAPAPPTPPSAPAPAAAPPADVVRPKGSTFWHAPVSPLREQPATTPASIQAFSSSPPAEQAEAGRDVERASQRVTSQSPFIEPENVLARAVMPLLRYAIFTGRSSPREFWGFAILLFGAMLIAVSAGSTAIGLTTLAVAVPSLAVAVRRCHDQNRSGWFVLLCCVPYVGWVIFLLMMSVRGSPGENRFGTNPMGRN